MSDESDIKNSLNLIRQAIIALDKKIEAQNKRLSILEEKNSIEQEKIFEHETENNWDVKCEEKEKKEVPVFEKEEYYKKSLEENIGGQWFARVGIAALVLGISFFLKYAFDNNWIGEAGRIFIGVMIGFGLLALGERTIRKIPTYGQVMTGGGIAVLYLSIYSAYSFYGLIEAPAAFLFMVLITAVGIILSLRYNALSLIMVAIIGGFATPILASSGQNNQIGLLSYLVLLDLAILAVAFNKNWRSLNMTGFIGTVILFLSWAIKYYSSRELGTTMLFLTIFFLIFSVTAVIFNLLKKEKSTGSEQLLILFSAITYFASCYALLNRDYDSLMGFLSLVLGLYYFLGAYALRNFLLEDENLYGFLAFLAIGFVTLFIPLQFSHNIITISWAIESALLLFIAVKVKKDQIFVASLIAAFLSVARYLLIDISKYDIHTATIFNGIFLTSLMLIGVFYIMANILRIHKESSFVSMERKLVIATFLIAANLLTIISISAEISRSYEKRIYYANDSISLNIDRKNNYENPFSLVNKKEINSLRNKKSISLSIFWLIYAIILVSVGMITKIKGVRIGGLSLLVLSIFKLFIIDLWSLGTLYRIISSMSLGVVLLSISYTYQKNKNNLREII